MIEEIKIPEISENVTSGKVVKVLVKKGDTVAVDDILIEFETEKALVEIPSTAAGVIVELLAEEGREMQVGEVIAKVETDKEAQAEEGAEAASSEDAAPEKKESAPGPEERESDQEESAPDQEESKPDTDTKDTSSGRAAKETKTPSADEKEQKKASAEPKKAEAPSEGDDDKAPPVAAAPSVRRLARELGVAIRRVRGTGPGDRITADDVKTAARETLQERKPAADAATAADGAPEMPDFRRWGDIETEELSGVRRLTARSTAISWRTVPHVTQFDQADITDLENFIQKEASRLKKEGVKLTVTAVVLKVVALALQRFPRFNASIDPAQERIIYKKYVHIGMAVATDRGLLVPVVRNADGQTIDQLAAAVADLAERSRNKKIKPDEMEGGTFTISNQGGIGGTQFTPIVMWPQSAILGMSRAAVAPVYRDGGFVPRTLLPLALSYDHRLNDGADAARFLRFICESLAQPMHLFMGG
ncbi:2-oxo acid dehydrogenase subunit E2 [Desulfatitalea alkaliphila]|uniref:Dihydrolipoamide acetyltransferase component of pyruvate dehydrogenase complex n=1 Tax=Desulfatitalea alkaliphila TaxID=2929485 RepID=A0AA41R1A7_9BACT|nr:2-oxo acid dehydrogenase subunit E2 [Desulfatitalea alkaliphila]MCJ8501047.1 2-oxo acid dehydrogenase subunit E2 [Desulfatitalea alkaliphila]